MATQGVGCDSWLAAGSGVGSGCAPDPALDSSRLGPVCWVCGPVAGQARRAARTIEAAC